MYRDEADLQLLAELAGVLDQTVAAAGLSPGEYLVLRRLSGGDDPQAVTGLAEVLGAQATEVADVTGRLVSAGMARVAGGGIAATDAGRARSRQVEEAANEAILSYVLERPHTATVYGLVASMQAGRFTVEDLLEFLAEGPTGEDGE